MPQMMPINWTIIFLMCLTCLFTIFILMNAFSLYIKMKDTDINNNKFKEMIDINDINNNIYKNIDNNNVNNNNKNNKNNSKKKNNKNNSWKMSW